MKNSKLKASPIAGLFLGILAVSTASIFIRFAQEETSSLVIAAGRMSIAALILAPFALKRSIGELRLTDRKTLFLLILAGFFLGLHFAAWITSLEYTSVASSVVLVTTAPLWVALLSPLFLKEKISGWIFVGLLISLAGSCIVGLNSACQWAGGRFVCESMASLFQGRAFWGNVLALAGALLSGGYLMVGRSVRGKFSLSTYTFVVYGMAALVLLGLVAVTGTSIGKPSPAAWLWIVLLGVVPQIIGHSTFNYFLKYLSATFVSIALLGEPVGTVILAYLFLRESPSWMEVAGGVLILAGIAVATITNQRQSQKPKLEE